MIKVLFRFWGISVEPGPGLLRTGWYGGQVVRFTGNMVVEKGLHNEVVGMMLRGYKLEDYDGKQYDFSDMDGLASLRPPYKYENNPVIGSHKAVMLSDDGMFDLNMNAYDTTKIYTYNQKLYSNDQGVITNEDLGGADCIGVVAGLPSDLNGWMRAKIKW